MGETTVVNLRRGLFDVYIGRAGRGFDGYFGNPYTVREHGRDAIELFRDYFNARVETDEEFRRRVLGLHGKILGCFCKPGPCHGDVIAEWVNAEVGREVWLAGLAKSCASCSCCRDVPCGACQAGGVCDAMPCLHEHEEDGSVFERLDYDEAQSMDDLDAEGELP